LSLAYGKLSEKDYKTGVLYQKLGRYQSARIYFQGMIDEFPESPLVPEALYRMGEGQRKLDSLDSAIEYYEKVLYVYPESDRADDAKKRVARIARERERDKPEPAASADSTNDDQ
jgi:TolA-binding protein